MSNNNQRTQGEILLEIAEEFKFFRDEMGEACAKVQIEDHWEVMMVAKDRFRELLMYRFYQETGKAPQKDILSQVIGVLKARAKFSGTSKKLFKRVGILKGDFYYDLVNKEHSVVKISSDGCEVIENAPTLFQRTSNMSPQVYPTFDVENHNVINGYFKLKKKSHMILLKVYMASCFIPEIPRPILNLAGGMGSSKSTTLRKIKKIIDPSKRDLLTMPNGINELSQLLSNNYMACFDNLDSLSPEKSDHLCRASTGGSFSKRKLFSDDEDIIFDIKRPVALNGINIVATRPDLLDRSIILQLERIPKEERKDEATLWHEFDEDLPVIVGSLMDAVACAKKMLPEINLDKLPRMADFGVLQF